MRLGQHAMELVSEIGRRLFRSQPRTTVNIVLASAACCGCSSTRQCLRHN